MEPRDLQPALYWERCIFFFFFFFFLGGGGGGVPSRLSQGPVFELPSSAPPPPLHPLQLGAPACNLTVGSTVVHWFLLMNHNQRVMGSNPTHCICPMTRHFVHNIVSLDPGVVNMGTRQEIIPSNALSAERLQGG